MFDERGLCDHAHPQLRALIGVWTFEGDEVSLTQIRSATTPRRHRKTPQSPCGWADLLPPLYRLRLEILPTGHVPFSSDPVGFLAVAAPFLAGARDSVQ
jgi:hypothetical protein